jgi:hypothetical protein
MNSYIVDQKPVNLLELAKTFKVNERFSKVFEQDEKVKEGVLETLKNTGGLLNGLHNSPLVFWKKDEGHEPELFDGYTRLTTCRDNIELISKDVQVLVTILQIPSEDLAELELRSFQETRRNLSTEKSRANKLTKGILYNKVRDFNGSRGAESAFSRDNQGSSDSDIRRYQEAADIVNTIEQVAFVLSVGRELTYEQEKRLQDLFIKGKLSENFLLRRLKKLVKDINEGIIDCDKEQLNNILNSSNMSKALDNFMEGIKQRELEIKAQFEEAVRKEKEINSNPPSNVPPSNVPPLSSVASSLIPPAPSSNNKYSAAIYESTTVNKTFTPGASENANNMFRAAGYVEETPVHRSAISTNTSNAMQKLKEVIALVRDERYNKEEIKEINNLINILSTMITKNN